MDLPFTKSDARRAIGHGVQSNNMSTNWAALSIGLAQIKEVHEEENLVDLVVFQGESQIQEFKGVELTFPGGGRRHILASLPERGDLCVVGWAVRESSGTASSKSPIVLGWLSAPSWMGHSWVPYQPMEPGEGMDTPGSRAVASGTLDRVRTKLRHASPGSILASSSQGSDLVLDESVLLTDRRGSEIHLRDNDGAIVSRSVQSFSATSGVRVYSGPVQREADLLPSTVWSDGIYWDQPGQRNADGSPLDSVDLTSFEYPEGFLVPGLPFRRLPGEPSSAFERARDTSFGDHLDPFDFLKWGSFVDDEGFRTSTPQYSAVYGGKPLYRVGLTPDGRLDNAVVSRFPESEPVEALTEHRIEVYPSSDGTLPVTEQTDGFDADRLPHGAGLEDTRSVPLVEWVLGSVVGNDPYHPLSRFLYGVPLKPRVLDSTESPTLVSAMGSPVETHSATLLRINTVSGVPSFSSWTKDGRYFAYVSGGTPGSLGSEISVASDLSLSVGGTLNLDLRGGLRISGGRGLSLGGSSSPTIIEGGGGIPSSGSVSGSPSVQIRGAREVDVSAGQRLYLHSPTISLRDAESVDLNSQSLLALRSGSRITQASQTLDVSVTGREDRHYGGPRNGDPTTGPVRSVVFAGSPATGLVGGSVDSYHVRFGDREEVFDLGSHKTTARSGSLTYESLAGDLNLRSGTNTVEMKTSGMDVVTNSGSISVRSAARVSVSAAQSISVEAGTTATIRGSSVVLKAPGSASGDIVCGSDLDPLTGLPMSTFLLPKNQRLSA